VAQPRLGEGEACPAKPEGRRRTELPPASTSHHPGFDFLETLRLCVAQPRL